uniref:Uncharacterized protein n=1 Tax=Candidatus Kentrum sp. LPFa TaxID=2126335 RepID=A0A450X666_9GAMM|nr:MAG: hypothetical protein BECKLPF1236B_GA0070989_14282 [Candidatus Kentron sp. LPFa]
MTDCKGVGLFTSAGFRFEECDLDDCLGDMEGGQIECVYSIMHYLLLVLCPYFDSDSLVGADQRKA